MRTTWQIDPTHTSVHFAVRHLMIATVRGHFGTVSGTASMDESDPSSLQLDVSIDVSTIDTRNEQRDAHLRSADFFDVEKYPTMSFRSRKVEGETGGEFKLMGDLTLHGVTRPVTLDVESTGRGKDPWGNQRAGFAAKGKLNRKDFGLTWNQALETGGVVVGDEVRIEIDVELVQQKPESKVA